MVRLSAFEELLRERCKLTEVDTSAYSGLRVRGMKFRISAYEAEGLGHVSFMSASGFCNLMKMDTMIITPREKDLPLYSYDRILAAGNDTLMIEMYDTLTGEYPFDSMEAVREKFAAFPERDPGKHWYDPLKIAPCISFKGKKVLSPSFDALSTEFFLKYLELPAGSVSDPELKAEKTAHYVNGLLSNGGPSTDVFMKALGPGKTRELFCSILFGTRNT